MVAPRRHDKAILTRFARFGSVRFAPVPPGFSSPADSAAHRDPVNHGDPRLLAGACQHRAGKFPWGTSKKDREKSRKLSHWAL